VIGQQLKIFLRALGIEQKLLQAALNTADEASCGAVMRPAVANNPYRAEDCIARQLAIQENWPRQAACTQSRWQLWARMMRRKGRLSEAAQLLDQSLRALENQIANLVEQKTSVPISSRYVRLLLGNTLICFMAQKQPELAFHIAERLRASLCWKHRVARVDIHTGADIETATA